MKTSIKRVLLATAVVGLSMFLRAEPMLVGNKSLAGQSLDADGIKAVLVRCKACNVSEDLQARIVVGDVIRSLLLQGR